MNRSLILDPVDRAASIAAQPSPAPVAAPDHSQPRVGSRGSRRAAPVAPIIFDGNGQPLVARRQANGLFSGGYQGATNSITRSYIPGQLTDSRHELSSYTRTELARKSLYFKKNIGMPRGVAKSLVDHAIGPGVYPIPCTADDEWNEFVWGKFWELAKVAEVSGRMTLWETQRQRTAAKFWEGEMFNIHTRSAAGWPQFQCIRSHNCGQFDVKAEAGWVDGVQLDSVNRARAYRFRLTGEGRYITVPAASVVHSYLLESVDGVRGVTPLASAINRLHDIMDTLALEMDAVKELSRTARVITKLAGEDDDPGAHFTSGAGNTADWESSTSVRLEELFGAEIKHLNLGEKMESFRHERPSPTFTGFIDYIGRDVTVSTGFPYEFAWNPSGINSAAIRFILDKVRVACDEWRRNEIEDTYPFYTFAVATMIDMGEIPARSDWWKVDWLPGAEDVTIDHGRESASEIERVKAALNSFKRYFASRGLWWKTELRQKAVEAAFIKDLAREYDVPEDRIHQLTANSGATSPSAPNASDTMDDRAA